MHEGYNTFIKPKHYQNVQLNQLLYRLGFCETIR